MNKILQILLLINFSAFLAPAQSVFKYLPYNLIAGDIQVLENGKQLKSPFAGGIDASQFSACDLDLDGKKDLILYDREGYARSCFLNKGNTNEINYIYDNSYLPKFPKMGDWMLMVDYNQDGKEDLFFDNAGSIACYKNISTSSTGFKLELVSNGILFTNSVFTIEIGIFSNDLPALVDFDDDGDLDIFRFSSAISTPGEPVEWYKNLTMEKYGTAGLDTFLLWKRCWGRFIEDNNGCNLILNYPGEPCASGNKPFQPQSLESYLRNVDINKRNNRHAGSTCLIADFNGDHKKDILIGDAGCDNMYLALNGNTNIDPIMNQVITSFPTTHPINVKTFPAAFLIDVNNDSLKDLIACPNNSAGSNNFNNVHLYLNTGTISNPIFTFETDRFLSNEMIEVGEGACPAFVDYNQDGLMDIFIGSTGYFNADATYNSGITVYRNIGSPTLPKFELLSRDYGNFSSLGIAKLSPAFKDLDQDGDIDMVAGSADGYFYYFENIAGINNPFNLQIRPSLLTNLDVGNNANPFIYDLDKDGIQDILSGENFYNFNLMNGHSLTNPSFTFTTDSLFKINLNTLFQYPSGKGSVLISKLFPSDKDRLIVSNANGIVYLFDTLYSNYSIPISDTVSSFSLNQGNFTPSNYGFKIDMADINNDGKPEIIAGTPRGGIAIYSNSSLSNGLIPKEINHSVKLFPNPSSSIINIEMNKITFIKNVQLISSAGTIIPIYFRMESTVLTLENPNLAKGIYQIRIFTKDQIYQSKVIIE